MGRRSGGHHARWPTLRLTAGRLRAARPRWAADDHRGSLGEVVALCPPLAARGENCAPVRPPESRRDTRRHHRSDAIAGRRRRMSADERLAALGLTLPPPPKPLGNYVPFRLAGSLLFLSGVGPRRVDGTSVTGKVGAEVSLEQAQEAAKLCGLNLLTNMISAVGSLERIDTVLKVLGMVNAVPEFTRHPQ